MSDEYDEALLRITASYVDEVQAGLHPSLGAYIARYPRYADEIVQFVAYYHSVEATVSEDVETLAPLSDLSRVALDTAHKRLLSPTKPQLRVAEKQALYPASDQHVSQDRKEDI